MVANAVTFGRIGNFLAYGIKYVSHFGTEENIQTMQSNLRSLMTENEINQLTFSILIGINTYSNLDLLESSEHTFFLTFSDFDF